MPIFDLPSSSQRAKRGKGGFINDPRQTQTAHNFGWVYKSARWKALVAELKRLRGERCQDVEHTPDKAHTNIDADHITELQDGGAPFDPNNILLRCRSCHVAKTSQRKRERTEREFWARRVRSTT